MLLDSTAADLRWFGDGVKTCCWMAGLAQIKDFVTVFEAMIFIEL
jgi:hypothetical protein